MSECERIRERLWPLDEPRRLHADDDEARTHLHACADCQAFFRRDAALASALASVELDVAAGAPLRHRILSALDKERPIPIERPGRPRPGRPRAGRLSRAGPALAIAAALILVAVGLLRVAPRNLDALYVNSYLGRDAEQVVLEAPDPSQAYEFFMRELGVPLTPVALGEGRLNRAMICRIEGRRMAMVEYELDGHMVAHYRGPIRPEDGGGAMHSATEDGVCVVRWSDGQFDHALVADIPEDELRVIAAQHFAALR